MTPTSGLINARNAKPPNPPPSPKSFVWPEKKAFTRELYELFAASVQELLAARTKTHVDMGKTFWGVTKIGACRSTKARSWLLAEGAVPDATEAAYVAESLGVPMARLLKPESAFNPSPKMFKPRGAAKHAQRARRAAPTTDSATPEKKRTYKKQKNGAANGAEVHDDGRWTLADDMPRPVMRLQTSPDRPSCVQLTLIAELPWDVGMALAQLVHHNKPGPAGQLLARVLATEVPAFRLEGPMPASATPQLPSAPEGQQPT